MHLFLSPHFDDAVLSCGGMIHKLTSAGEQVIVLTVMAGSPEPERMPDTPLIQELHARWGQGSDPISARRREDIDAIATLHAEVQHLAVWVDCIYRTSRSGQPLYPTVESIFGEIARDDQAAKLIPTVVLPQLANTRFLYAPLGLGHHVDHQIVRNWALELRKQNPALALKFYEEYPYSKDKTAAEQALAFFSTTAPPLQLEPDTVVLTEPDVDVKIKAIACYSSQISSFWESTEAMEADTRKAMLETGEDVPGERYWTGMFQ
jgi:LmbE family N-acetylglucosaminyl deacetylase